MAGTGVKANAVYLQTFVKCAETKSAAAKQIAHSYAKRHDLKQLEDDLVEQHKLDKGLTQMGAEGFVDSVKQRQQQNVNRKIKTLSEKIYNLRKDAETAWREFDLSFLDIDAQRLNHACMLLSGLVARLVTTPGPSSLWEPLQGHIPVRPRISV